MGGPLDTQFDIVEIARGADANEGPSDSELRFFYQTAPLLMGAVEVLDDGDLLHLHDNPASNEFFGLPPGSTRGRTARSMGVPEDIISLWRAYYAESGRAGCPVTFDYGHVQPGGVTWLSVTVAPLGRPAGQRPARYGYVARDVTKRRHAELALADSEARFRAIFEQAAVGIAHVALDGRWIRVNRRLCEILGYSEAEILGRTFQVVTHPDDLESDLAFVEKLLAGALDSYSMEKRYVRKDGKSVWAQLTVSLARDPEGRPEHFISVVQDSSEGHAAVAALRATEERFSIAARASGLGVWEWDQTTGGFYYSARAKEISGFKPDGPVTYEMVAGIVHPDDFPFTIEQSRRARDPQIRDTEPFIYRIIRPDGALRWVRAYADTVFENTPGGPRATRFLGTLEDITERRELDERLKTSEARLRLAMSAGRMAVFDWPLDQEDVPLTDEMRLLLGVPAGASSTVQERRDCYHPDDLALASSTRDRARSGEERFIDFEFRYYWPEGQLRWLQVRSEVLRAPSGVPERLVGVLLDVTERKKDEERLGLLMREVDHRANNLLTVVQGLVSLSTGDRDPDLRRVLLGRVDALGHAHKLLAEARWTGADLLRLVQEELRPHGVEDPGRVRLKGPKCSLAPAQAQAISMALHELATNAAKYGGLSVAQGVVSVTWTRVRGTLDLLWQESGGPPVRPPAREGLGTRILERALGGSIGGSVAHEWPREGHRCRITMPLSPPAGA